MSTTLSPLNNLIQDLFGPEVALQNLSTAGATGNSSKTSQGAPTQDVVSLTGSNGPEHLTGTLLFEQATVLAGQPAAGNKPNTAANQLGGTNANAVFVEEAALLMANFAPAQAPVQQPAANPAAAAAPTANATDANALAADAAPAAAATPAQAQAPTAQNANAGVVAAMNNSAASTALTPQQQELQQLDQILQELGFDPATFPVFNQVAMLLYENNPAALEQFIQTLQGSVAQLAGQSGAAAAAAPVQQNQPAATQGAQGTLQTQAAAQTAPEAQAPQIPNQNQANVTVEAIAVQLNFSENNPAPAPVSSGNQAAAATQIQPAQAGTPNAATTPITGFAAQFRELQISFQEFGNEGQAAQGQNENQNSARAASAADGRRHHGHRQGLDVRA